LVSRVSGGEPGAVIQPAIGVAVLVASAGLVAKGAFAGRPADGADTGPVPVRRVPTLLVGMFGGAAVGVTSVGSGSLMMPLLLLLYPALTARRLVGTDLVQAVPLVGSAALGHALFGHVELGLTVALLAGALPGVWLGAHVSIRAADDVIRPVLA